MLFVTPEYNRSVPGGLKNALDVGSRPSGESVFSGRPAGVVSVTPYKLGAFGANHALRQTFVFLDMPVMQQPEAYVPKAGELFDDQGALKSDDTRQFLPQFMVAFGQWIEKNSSAQGASGDFKSFMAAARRDRARVCEWRWRAAGGDHCTQWLGELLPAEGRRRARGRTSRCALPEGREGVHARRAESARGSSKWRW